MFTCDKCEKVMDTKFSCPNCGATFCQSCIDDIKKHGNKCPECGVAPDAELRRRADTRTRGNPF